VGGIANLIITKSRTLETPLSTRLKAVAFINLSAFPPKHMLTLRAAADPYKVCGGGEGLGVVDRTSPHY